MKWFALAKSLLWKDKLLVFGLGTMERGQVISASENGKLVLIDVEEAVSGGNFWWASKWTVLYLKGYEMKSFEILLFPRIKSIEQAKIRMNQFQT